MQRSDKTKINKQVLLSRELYSRKSDLQSYCDSVGSLINTYCF